MGIDSTVSHNTCLISKEMNSWMMTFSTSRPSPGQNTAKWEQVGHLSNHKILYVLLPQSSPSVFTLLHPQNVTDTLSDILRFGWIIICLEKVEPGQRSRIVFSHVLLPGNIELVMMTTTCLYEIINCSFKLMWRKSWRIKGVRATVSLGNGRKIRCWTC